MNITKSKIDRTIDRYKGLRIGRKEYKDIVGILVEESFTNTSRSKVMELIELFISAETKPIYLNEVKNYLFENNRALYERYASMFLKNPGVFEAFGVQGEERSPAMEEEGPTEFKSLKPKLGEISTKRKSKSLRKAIHRESKISAHRKIMEEKSASIEYQKKIDSMYRKARKE